MQTLQDVSAEELAKLFYIYRDTLASDFGLQSSEGSVPWEQLLPEHRNLMVASARLVLRDLAGVRATRETIRWPTAPNTN